MADTSSFTKLVPGFDFLQSLVKNAGSAIPSIGQWVAPTLNPEELEKRIEELRTVQFWLEQNARMLGATIQALEVQRMTLSTLKTMNVQMNDLKDSLTLKDGLSAAPSSTAPIGQRDSKSSSKAGGASKAGAPTTMGSVDPMQWWGALTKQFTQLAATAMKDTATDAAKDLAGAMVKQSFDAASGSLKSAMTMPMKVASRAASSTASTAANVAKAARTPAAPSKRAAKSTTTRKR